MPLEEENTRTRLARLPAAPAVGPVPTLSVPELPPKLDPGGHVPALDGVRGVAILLVILHHTVHAWGPPASAIESVVRSFVGHAWVGVDLFFVLSGYLITGILCDTREHRRYFGSFYPRRMLRTFPLYYATLAVCFLILPTLPLAELGWLRDLATRQGWFWLHSSNFYAARMDGPDPGWMSTFWSLAVEEQFYLVWPVVVYFIPARKLVRLCVELLAAALLLRICFATEEFGFRYIYHHTLTRLDGILLGSLIAALSRCPGGLARVVPAARVLTVLCIAGLAGLIAIKGRAGDAYAFCAKTVVFTAVAVAFAGLLVLVIQSRPGSPLRRFFSHPFLQACGRYSFAMYILNIPILLLLERVFAPDDHLILGSRLPAMAGFAAVGVLLTLGGATLTWHLFEKHFLKLKRYFTPGLRH